MTPRKGASKKRVLTFQGFKVRDVLLLEVGRFPPGFPELASSVSPTGKLPPTSCYSSGRQELKLEGSINSQYSHGFFFRGFKLINRTFRRGLDIHYENYLLKVEMIIDPGTVSVNVFAVFCCLLLGSTPRVPGCNCQHQEKNMFNKEVLWLVGGGSNLLVWLMNKI